MLIICSLIHKKSCFLLWCVTCMTIGLYFQLHLFCFLSATICRGWEGWASHLKHRREPKEHSFLIKGAGAKPQLKIETKGDWHRFVQALTARLTAAQQHWGVEPSRESARLPMMRWDGKITSDKPSSRHPALITLSPPQTHEEKKVITTHTHTHTPPNRHTNICIPLRNQQDFGCLSVHLSDISCQVKAHLLTYIQNTSGRPSTTASYHP